MFECSGKQCFFTVVLNMLSEFEGKFASRTILLSPSSRAVLLFGIG